MSINIQDYIAKSKAEYAILSQFHFSGSFLKPLRIIPLCFGKPSFVVQNLKIIR